MAANTNGIVYEYGSILFKEEATYGTDPTPAAGQGCPARNLTVTPMTDLHELGGSAIGDITERNPITGARWYEIGFDVDLVGSGTAGTAPNGVGDLLEASGFSETVVGGTSVTYADASSSLKSGTAYIFLDGIKMVSEGCRVSSFTITADAGMPFVANFKLLGLFNEFSDSALTAPTLHSTDPDAVMGTNKFQIASTNHPAETATITVENQIHTAKDFNATYGVKEHFITKHKITLAYTSLRQLLATLDVEALVDAQSAFSWANGGDAGNIITITSSDLYLQQPKLVNNNGVAYNEMAGQFRSLSIAFT